MGRGEREGSSTCSRQAARPARPGRATDRAHADREGHLICEAAEALTLTMAESSASAHGDDARQLEGPSTPTTPFLTNVEAQNDKLALKS
jgi:hypothetical protein